MSALGASLGRVGAVAATDLRVRFRRPSTLVLLALLALGAYAMVPDPRTGEGILKIGGRRALYTSAALAVATGGLLPLLLGLVGFYLGSGGVAADRRSGAGLLLAATPVRGTEYLTGKLLAGAGHLAAIALAFCASSMALQVVVGEAPLEPGVFLAHYAVLGVPLVFCVAAFSLLFETVPALSGRGGDVLYFFVWTVLLSLAAALGDPSSGRLAPFLLDYSGFGFLFSQMRQVTGATSFSIGWGGGGAAGPPYVFPGFVLDGPALLRRALSLAPVPVLLALSVLAFRRFDPSREASGTGARTISWRQRLEGLLRPLTSRLLALVPRGDDPGRRPSFARALAADVERTFRQAPLLVAVAMLALLGALLGRAEWVRGTLLPGLVAALVPALADVACRDHRSGTASLVLSSPRVPALFVPWKVASASLTGLVLTAPVFLRLSAGGIGSALPVLSATLFLAALATLLGVATSGPKLFVGVGLALWYVALNDRGRVAALDFAGWAGAAGPWNALGWLVAAGCAGAAAWALHGFRERVRVG